MIAPTPVPSPDPLSMAINIGGTLLGGLFGKKKKKPKTQAQQFRELVAAARAEGIHPLAAIGYQTPSYQEDAGQPDYGSAIKDAFNAAKPKTTSHEDVLRQREVQSRIDLNKAEEMLLLSEAARKAQAANSQPTNIDSTTLTGPGGGKFTTSASTPQQIVEDQYGGVVGEAYGIYRAASDHFGKKRTPSADEFTQWARKYAPKHGRRTYDFNRR